MLTRLAGKVMAASPEPLNALSPMLVRPAGSVMPASLAQQLNVPAAMPVTRLGMVMLV